ncbi:MAG: AzlD domain-containing protein [Lachnospiraceae bacterium]|nr:AzlD domain-containing protein [Lachnospiraceae bacterium]
MQGMEFVIYLLICAGVTYLIRMIPFVLCRGKLENRFIRSFLFYVPYAVLGSMTFPAIFTSTGSVFSGCAGTVTALILAFHRKGLMTVAVGACIAAFAAEVLQAIL